VYADQNHARVVRRTLEELIGRLSPQAVALNIGAGQTDYPGVTNLEICDGPAVDIIGHGSTLPFNDASVDLVIAQEVLEHVADYPALVCEIHRVLKPGGVFYCQVPFQIGFHPGPADYWRFSRQALEYLFSEPCWTRESLQITLGHGSGFYRISVEFLAVTFSCFSQRFYRPSKAAAALLCYPLKIFDLLTQYSLERDRIPGGYLCVARKL
jgi:SAM-dependent methyltransferase